MISAVCGKHHLQVKVSLKSEVRVYNTVQVIVFAYLAKQKPTAKAAFTLREVNCSKYIRM